MNNCFIKYFLVIVSTLGAVSVKAQDVVHPEDKPVDMDNPTFVPLVKVGKTFVDGDSIQYVEMNRIYVFPALNFKSDKKRQAYNRMVYNIKKVLPIAKEVRSILIETYEYLETLPDEQAKQEHLKYVEKSVKKEYTPRMKKLTFTQGKILIKLIYRECNSTSYDLIKAFLGPFRAAFWQTFAYIFGANLKKQLDPTKEEDQMIERIVLQVEAGQL